MWEMKKEKVGKIKEGTGKDMEISNSIVYGNLKRERLKEKGRNIERYGNFRYERMWELKKRKVEIERKEQGNKWKFLIQLYMGTEKEKGWKRKEGILKDMEISDMRVCGN
jgi:hypothetical protein